MAAVFLSHGVDYDPPAVGKDLSIGKMVKSGFYCFGHSVWFELGFGSGFLALAISPLIDNNNCEQIQGE
jgi:hypothetical protein